MSFLPINYESPKTNHYMKLKNGENKFRILSKPVLGWEDWTPEKKPVRYRYSQKAPRAIVESRPVKHFWSFIVWNYEEGRIQILHLTQATVRDALMSLSLDKDWGEPFFYDIKIVKTGEETKTKYVVSPLPHKPISANIKQAFADNRCCLEALFDNANPFEPNPEREPTEGVFSEADLKKASAFDDGQPGSFEQLKNLLDLDGISTQNLKEFVELKAKEKAVTFEQVVGGALFKEFLPRFKTAFTKWVNEYKNAEEAIPF